MHLDSYNLKKEIKKLKRYREENQMLEKIIKHIKICGSCNELKNNPMSRIYDFEELKHELNGYCSFRLEKNGTIRLIVKIFEEENCVKIEYISMDHYSDFKRMLKKSKGE